MLVRVCEVTSFAASLADFARPFLDDYFFPSGDSGGCVAPEMALKPLRWCPGACPGISYCRWQYAAEVAEKRFQEASPAGAAVRWLLHRNGRKRVVSAQHLASEGSASEYEGKGTLYSGHSINSNLGISKVLCLCFVFIFVAVVFPPYFFESCGVF